MELTVTVKKWYVVTGTAGATVTSPDGSKTFCTIPDGGQATFYATTPKVVTSDDSVEVVEATFNSAPAKLKALGLLGGGSSTGLPAGYLEAAFLQSDYTYVPGSGNVPYIAFRMPISSDMYIRTKCTYLASADNATVFGEVATTNRVSLVLNWSWSPRAAKFLYGTTSSSTHFNLGATPVATATTIEVNSNGFYVNGVKKVNRDKSVTELTEDDFYLFKFAEGVGGKTRIFTFASGVGETKYIDFVAAISPSGNPCMFDKVSKKAYTNAGVGAFIVGFTLEQACKLGKLPASGGTLKVSLPSNYTEDDGVVDALATAQERGWVITIQTYEAETGAASTFSLRRIWVRKVENEQGSYVDTDGTRWQVEWCVDIIGSSPEQEGYEPFRSVEAACEYWGLEPYVDPAWEEELLTETN